MIRDMSVSNPIARDRDEWPPSRVNMPDISDLKKDLLPISMVSMFVGKAPRKHPARAYWLTLVRLVDKAVFEYGHAQVAVEAARELPKQRKGLVLLPFDAVGHFENCINAMHRAMNFVKALQSARLRKPDGSPVVPRGLPVLSTDATSRIDKMRNAIEHTEKDIAKGVLAVGQPLFLAIGEDDIRLPSVTIRYSELASWIEQLQHIALELSQYQEPSGATELTTES